jgi:DHA1 family bicyclomycin/chloramphenicol resistance-like MFS transporter
VEACGPALILPPLLISCFARGVLSPNLVHLAISRHRESAGLASAMVGLTQLLVGAVASAAVAALLPSFGYTGVATPMAVLACAAALLWPATARRKRALELSEMAERR